MPAKFVVTIVSTGESSLKPLHPSNQIGFRSFHQEMIVITHDHITVNLPPCLFACFTQAFQQRSAFSGPSKDHLPPISPAHHVIKRAWEFDSNLPRHTGILNELTGSMKDPNIRIIGLTPFARDWLYPRFAINSSSAEVNCEQSTSGTRMAGCVFVC